MVFKGIMEYVETPVFFVYPKFLQLDPCCLNSRSSAVRRAVFALRAYSIGKALFACRKERIRFFTLVDCCRTRRVSKAVTVSRFTKTFDL
jgi:hypothetical protein